ncbi:hypothetical protein AAFF_G00407060 [Aldrovandia affinis]|uniref:VWFA domain-containing protein n=1 Tax=Aldrovandia affinis TaxID=143900 RepID=A0AAD7SC81_9TELE|nr:hypothetical protein AAFF_G00407060 [Aldrovandia affinis]
MDWIVILTFYICTVSQPGDTFNVDPDAWKSFNNPATAFGYRVIQANRMSLLVSAPLHYNQDKTGTVYNCNVRSSTCSQISIQVPSHGINMSLGLSMSKDPTSEKTLVCGPTIRRDCFSITTYNGMCFQLNERLIASGTGVPQSLRDCPHGTDIVFLMDGSGSVSPLDFSEMKDFVIKMIEQLLGRNSQFAVMQYSNRFQTVFDFKKFKNNADWRVLINKVVQQQGGTYTPTAISLVANTLFVPESGSQPDANKVLLVITDGITFGDNMRLTDAIATSEKKHIIRYAIGVGDNFQALDKIRDTLQKNIFAIEGTQTSGESFHFEMAQEGFSSALYKGDILMGVVGAFDWKGGYQQFLPSTPINSDLITSINVGSDSYLGYSMAIAEINNGERYTILGAPRYQHAGRVIIFRKTQDVRKLESQQIGSYYGAEVCTVDLNSDSKTDLLLISAPMYIDKQRNSEGKVYVCTFINRAPIVECTNALVGEQGVKGRFGTSISALADLNGDGISEVAVGAPLEDNGQGSIYIFNGFTSGVKSTYSQRIQSSSVQPRLQYFGQSVSGSLDQTGDKLTDIAVGSKGKVLLLRSRPVVFVDVAVAFSPSKILIIDCSKTTPITATVCFSMQRRTKDLIGDLKAQVAYTFRLDATRSRFRAYFTPTNRTQEKVFTLKLKGQCDSIGFVIAECPEDVLNHIFSELTFRFHGLPSEELNSQKLSPILDPQSRTTTNHPLEFEKDCGTDNKCIDNLKVDFNFTGASEVQVGIVQVLNVTVSVENLGENSYNTHVIFTYPAGLSYRRATVVQEPSSRATVQCSGFDGEDGTTLGKSVCFINKPIFNSNAQVIFIISFGIDADSHYDQIVTFTANATSETDESITRENFKAEKINVKYNIYILIKGLEETTSYINFTAGKNDLKTSVRHSFEVVNYIRDLNATVIFKVPIKLGDKNIWSDGSSIQIPGCLQGKDEKPNITNFVEGLKNNPIVDCTVSTCRVIRCNVFLRKGDQYSYNISGEVSSVWIEQTQLTSLYLVSKAVLDYDTNQFIYASSSSQNSPRATEVRTRVEVYSEADFTKEIIGGAVGGLLLLALITAGLYKAGFFKSQFKQIQEEADGDAGEADGAVGEAASPDPE